MMLVIFLLSVVEKSSFWLFLVVRLRIFCMGFVKLSLYMWLVLLSIVMIVFDRLSLFCVVRLLMWLGVLIMMLMLCWSVLS